MNSLVWMLRLGASAESPSAVSVQELSVPVLPATLSVTVTVQSPPLSSPRNLLAVVENTIRPPTPLAGWATSVATRPQGEFSVTTRSLAMASVMLRSTTMRSMSSPPLRWIVLFRLPEPSGITTLVALVPDCVTRSVWVDYACQLSARPTAAKEVPEYVM